MTQVKVAKDPKSASRSMFVQSLNNQGQSLRTEKIPVRKCLFVAISNHSKHLNHDHEAHVRLNAMQA